MDFYLSNDGEQVQAMHMSPEMVQVISAWSGAVIVEEIDPLDTDQRYSALNVQTADGVKRASQGDYVVRHADGSFDVKKPTEFRRGHRSWEP